MQLADDDTLGAVDNERAVLGHQRNFTEINLLLLDVANRFCASVGVFIEDRQANDDFQRRGIGHATFLTLRHVVLQIQLNRVATLIAERHLVPVRRAALRAHDRGFGLKRIGCDACAARLTSAAQMMQTLQVSALAFPVTDGIADKLER